MIKTTCPECGRVCETPKAEVRKSFRIAKRRIPWHFNCKPCGTLTPIDTSEVRKDLK